MPSSILEYGPAVLVPAAWSVVLAAVTGTIGSDPLVVAHVVMSLFLLAFLGFGWQQMDRGVFRIWRLIILIGLVVTLISLGGFLGPQPRLLAVGLYGWMVLPAAGLVQTGLAIETRGWIYVGGGLLSLLGAIIAVGVSAIGPVAGLELGIVLVGIAQTVGIVDAVRR